VRKRLRAAERTLIADAFDDVTILWTDVKGFTNFSSTRSPAIDERMSSIRTSKLPVCRMRSLNCLPIVLAFPACFDIP
jgi:hypothetical protein